MKKKGNIAFTLVVALLVVCGGAAILNIASTGRYNAKTEYERIENRYISESGIDIAVGLFINYLSNRQLTVSYESDGEGNINVISQYSPFILDETATEENDEIYIEIVSDETNDYLSSIGYPDFKKAGGVKLFVNTYGDIDSLRISNMCTEPDFLIAFEPETEGEKRSLLNPVFLTVLTEYRGGRVMSTLKLSNIYAVRNKFENIGPNEIGNTKIHLDVDNIKIEYIGYQNYGGYDK